MELEEGTEALPTAESLLKGEWKQIEDISAFQRRLGAVMIEQGRRLFAEFQSAAPDEKIGGQNSGAFDAELWKQMAALVAPHMRLFSLIWLPTAGGKATRKLSRKEQMKEDLRRQQAKRQAERCFQSLREGLPPPRHAVCSATHLLALQCQAENKLSSDSFDATQVLLELQSWGLQPDVPLEIQLALRQHLVMLWRSRCAIPLAEEMWELPRLWRKFLGAPARLPPEAHLQTCISLYADQVEFARAVLRAVSAVAPPDEELGPHVVCYRTPPSGGKTAAAALLGVLLQLRAAKKEATKQWLVYSCYSNAVRIDVARMLLAADVPFAMVSAGAVSPSFRCYHGRPPPRPRYEGPQSVSGRLAFGLQRHVPLCDREPVAWICDLLSAQALMRVAPGSHVLMVDEPTAAFSEALARAQLALLRLKPLVLCLVSATLPALDTMPNLLRSLRPRSVVDVVATRSTASCWASLGAQRSSCAPHSLLSPAALIDSSSRRWLVYYCPEALIHLSQTYPKAWAAAWKSEDLLAWTTSACQNLALRVLQEAAVSGEAPAFAAEPTSASETGLYLELALASDASRAFQGSTLWLMPSGCQQWLEQSHKTLLQARGPEHLKQAERARQLHLLSTKEACKKGKLHVDKRSGSGVDRRREKKERISALDRAQEAEAETELRAELWSHWPAELVLNSREHQRLRGASSTSSLMQTPPVPDEVACGSEAVLAACLLCGVGSLDEEQDQAYNTFVQDALRSQQLSVVMLPSHLLFGLNFPVDRVVLPSDASGLSVPEVQQAAGRAGRTGSASGEVVFASTEQARAVFLGVPLGSECSLERLSAQAGSR